MLHHRFKMLLGLLFAVAALVLFWIWIDSREDSLSNAHRLYGSKQFVEAEEMYGRLLASNKLSQHQRFLAQLGRWHCLASTNGADRLDEAFVLMAKEMQALQATDPQAARSLLYRFSSPPDSRDAPPVKWRADLEREIRELEEQDREFRKPPGTPD